jgi:hypothetical protein
MARADGRLNAAIGDRVCVNGQPIMSSSLNSDPVSPIDACHESASGRVNPN